MSSSRKRVGEIQIGGRRRRSLFLSDCVLKLKDAATPIGAHYAKAELTTYGAMSWDEPSFGAIF